MKVLHWCYISNNDNGYEKIEPLSLDQYSGHESTQHMSEEDKKAYWANCPELTQDEYERLENDAL